MFISQERSCFALSDDFHNFKRHALFNALVDEVNHDVVTGTDNFGNGAGSVFDKILCIADPNVGAVGKT